MKNTMNLLIKEWSLFSNPMNFLFLPLMAMVFIPSYPYYVSFFYILLGMFFSFQFGRENRDMIYMITLPIPKKDIVKARYLFAISLEMLAFTLGTILSILRMTLTSYDNKAGIEANLAFLGLSLIMVALFNIVFLGSYFKNVEKIGGAFLKGSTVVFVFMIFAEAAVHVTMAICGNCFFDSAAGKDLIMQIPILIVGIAFYVITMLLCYKRDVKHFEKIDL